MDLNDKSDNTGTDVREWASRELERGSKPRGAWRLPLLVFMGFVLFYVLNRPSGVAAISWEVDYDVATKYAQNRGLPLLVDFYADWSGPCKTLDRGVFTSEAVGKAVRDRYIAVRVDVSDRRIDSPAARLATKYADSLTGDLPLPSVVIINPADGSVVRRATRSDLASTVSFVAFLSAKPQPGK